MALINYMETYFKHTTPDITLISEEKFKINVHKEMFYQTQLMRTMIKSTDSDYCCSKVSIICSIPKEELKLIVQFLYSGKLFFKNQKELSQLSENLTGLFGFPKIHSSSKIEPKIEPASNSIAKEELSFVLTKSSNQKESRKQSLTSALVRDDFIEDFVPIKIQSENLADETNLDDDNLSDPLDTNVKGEDDETDTVCTICNKKFISITTLRAHVVGKHRDACNVCLNQFESKELLEAHISTTHKLSDFQKILRCVICDISYSKKDKDINKLREHMKSEHNVVGYRCSICYKELLTKLALRQHNAQEHDVEAESNIVCTICNKILVSKKKLNAHVIRHHRDACNVCLEQFESKQHLEVHITTAHSLSDFQKRVRCAICDFCYSKKDKDRSQLRKHMKSEHNVGYVCPICKMKLPSKLTLKQHNNQEHKTVIKESNLCSKCGKSFKLIKSLENHVSNNCSWKVGLRGNKCSICGETFESRSLNMEHVATMHKDVKLYDCTECSSRYITERGLKTHISRAHENTGGSICPICGKKLNSIYEVRRHTSFMHEGKARPKFKCTLCDKSYGTKRVLEEHMSVHEGKMFQCSNCDEEFNSKIKFERHFAKEHNRSNLHKCTQCDLAYVTKQNLLSHIAFVHEKTSSNVCPHCGKNCMRQSDLTNHIRKVHELAGIHPYKCKDCEKSFKEETRLKSHIKIIHDGTRVKCPVCQKPFVDKSVMKRHIDNVHEKKKPYGCDICNERFAQSGHLVTHKKGKHKIAM
jgi:KRAB domain-containing zinc finger protein